MTRGRIPIITDYALTDLVHLKIDPYGGAPSSQATPASNFFKRGNVLQGLPYNVKHHGAIGDGVTDDITAIESAVAAMPSTGGVLFFPPGIYLISHGFTVSQDNVTVIGYGATLYTDGASTRQIDIAGTNFAFYEDMDAQILVWNSGYGTFELTSPYIPAPLGTMVNNFRCYGLTFKGVGSMAAANPDDPNLLLVNDQPKGIALVGVVGGCVKDCVFKNFSVEALYGEALVQDFEIAGNQFADLAHDGVNIIVPLNISIHDNIFTDVWQPIENGGYLVDIYDNLINNTTATMGQIAIVVQNARNQLVRTRVYNNRIIGKYFHGIVVSDVFSDPDTLKEATVSGNHIGNGTDPSYRYYGGAHIRVAAGAYSACYISNNVLDDIGATVQFQAFIQIHGNNDTGKYFIHDNMIHVTTAFAETGILVAATNALFAIIEGNKASITGSGFVCSYTLASSYKGMIRLGANDATKQVLTDNSLDGEIAYIEATAITTMNIGSDPVYSTDQEKSIVQLFATRPFVAINTGVGDLTFTYDAGKIITLSGADLVLTTDQACMFAPVNQAGTIIRQITAAA